MTGANVRIWMIQTGIRPSDISIGHGCKPSFITNFLKGKRASQPLVNYLVEKGCPKENFEGGKIVSNTKRKAKS